MFRCGLARTAHGGHAEDQKTGRFQYNIPGMAAVDLSEPAERYNRWWGGFDRCDRYGDPRMPLRQTIIEHAAKINNVDSFSGDRNKNSVQQRCAVDAVGTLKAFGRSFNPLVVYLVWTSSERTDLVAIVLEVSNYPWRERVLYGFSAQQVGQQQQQQRVSENENSGKEIDVTGTCAKTLHVSPFHAHPAEASHHYRLVARLVCSQQRKNRAATGSSVPPFYSLKVKLFLHTGANPSASAGCASCKPLYFASLNVGELTAGEPPFWPVCVLTEARILYQAALSHGRKKDLHQNLTNPAAPIDIWTVALSFILFTFMMRGLVGMMSLHSAPAALGAVLAVWLSVLLLLRPLSAVPLIRDVALGISGSALGALILS